MSRELSIDQINQYWNTPNGWKTAEGTVAIQRAVQERNKKKLEQQEKEIKKQANIRRNKKHGQRKK